MHENQADPTTAAIPDPKLAEDPDSIRLRSILDSIPTGSDYGRWWGSEDGRWLLDRISARIACHLAPQFSRKYGTSFDVEDIAHNCVVLLSAEQSLLALRNSRDQWAYLYITLRNDLFKQMGTRGVARVDFDQVGQNEVIHEDERPDVDDAIEQTANLLRPLTPAAVRPHLSEVITYLAERGQSRISHAHTASANDEEITRLGLARPQILALANVVLGARPHHGETSILAAYLKSTEWDPSTSKPHLAALSKYKHRMTQKSNVSTPKLTRAV